MIAKNTAAISKLADSIDMAKTPCSKTAPASTRYNDHCKTPKEPTGRHLPLAALTRHLGQNSLLGTRRILVVSLLVAIVASSCSKPEYVRADEMKIKHRKFEPTYLLFDVPATLWWSNQDDEEHVISVEGVENWELVLPKRGTGDSKRGVLVSEPGEFTIFCKIHKFKGKVKAVPVSGESGDDR